MSDEEEKDPVKALRELASALRRWADAAPAVAALADRNVAAVWDGLRRQTAKLERELSAWSRSRAAALRDADALLARVRTLESAWTSAWDHLTRDSSPALLEFIEGLRQGALDFGRLADDDRRALEPRLKDAFREVASASAALERQPELSSQASPAFAELKAKLAEALRARVAAEDRARRLELQLDAARLRASGPSLAPKAESALVRAQSQELQAARSELQALREQLARAARIAASRETWTRSQGRRLERLTAEFEAVRAAVERVPQSAITGAPPSPPEPPPPPPPEPPPAPAAAAPPPVEPDRELQDELSRARAQIARLSAELERVLGKLPESAGD